MLQHAFPLWSRARTQLCSALPSASQVTGSMYLPYSNNTTDQHKLDRNRRKRPHNLPVRLPGTAPLPLLQAEAGLVTQRTASPFPGHGSHGKSLLSYSDLGIVLSSVCELFIPTHFLFNPDAIGVSQCYLVLLLQQHRGLSWVRSCVCATCVRAMCVCATQLRRAEAG